MSGVTWAVGADGRHAEGELGEYHAELRPGAAGTDVVITREGEQVATITGAASGAVTVGAAQLVAERHLWRLVEGDTGADDADLAATLQFLRARRKA